MKILSVLRHVNDLSVVKFWALMSDLTRHLDSFDHTMQTYMRMGLWPWLFLLEIKIFEIFLISKCFFPPLDLRIFFFFLYIYMCVCWWLNPTRKTYLRLTQFSKLCSFVDNKLKDKLFKIFIKYFCLQWKCHAFNIKVHHSRFKV